MRISLLILGLIALPMGLPAYEAVEFVSGLSSPVFLCAPAGDTERVFIVEQGGLIRIYDFDEGLLAAPFLDLTAIVSTGGERGLLGLAFHPDYESNGYFYVNFTSPSSDCAGVEGCTKILRFETSLDENLADPSSGFELLQIEQPFGNHNGGMIAFGPTDGYLYIGMGDGGSGGDPGNRAQDDQEYLGKLLRIDVDGGPPYGIPADNPFVGEAPLDEIWAKGLRNPWRFSFDHLTGDLWIGDVGQNLWEEVDFQPAASPGGENYGWRLMEGAHCYDPPVDCDDGSLVHPVHEYSHGSGCSITGGYLYHGGVSELEGLYLFADYCSGRVWALDPADTSVEEILTGQSLGNITSFGEDAQGEVYILTNSEAWLISSGETGVGETPAPAMSLAQNHPNPFNPRTEILVDIEAAGVGTLAVYDLGGRRTVTLHEGIFEAGRNRFAWDGRRSDGSRASSGVYLCRLETGSGNRSIKMTLIE